MTQDFVYDKNHPPKDTVWIRGTDMDSVRLAAAKELYNCDYCVFNSDSVACAKANCDVGYFVPIPLVAKARMLGYLKKDNDERR